MATKKKILKAPGTATGSDEKTNDPVSDIPMSPDAPKVTSSDHIKDDIVKNIAPTRISAASGISANVKVLELGAGLYSLSLGETKAIKSKFLGMGMPATYITGTPIDRMEIVAAAPGRAGWLGPEGGTIVVRVPPDGGHIWITTYRMMDQDAVPVEIQVTRLDHPSPKASAHGAAARQSSPEVEQVHRQNVAKPATRDVKVEIVLHIERLGDRSFPGGKWIGNQGQRRRIEAFGIRPLENLSPQDIEYKAFGLNGRETPWVTDAKLCGTRGQGMPLTGFAIRLTPRLSERYDIFYEGAFFDGGISGPNKNGEPCISTRLDDPLEDVNIRLVERL